MKFVGIDLGTTNSSLAYSDGSEIRDLEVAQLVSENTVLASTWLPSFLYLLQGDEFLQYPNDVLVPSLGFCGALARKRCGTETHRVVHSAKSWVGLGSVSSDSPILPFSEQATSKITAVEAQAAYLKHLAQCFVKQCGPMPSQVILTIPASFGDVSRRLTLKASEMAGMANVLLLEEPLAAFYNWQHYHGTKELPQSVLVVDIGGGTTDFSLLCLKEKRYSREAVGRHLLLGGDNLDLFMALKVEADFGFKLSPSEFSEILSQCRDYKEILLSDSEIAKELQFTLAGRGSNLFQKAKVINLKAQAIKSLLIDGFFPRIESLNVEKKLDNDTGFRQFGLPYEKNPAITEHLRQFLAKHAPRLCPNGPDAILFHGGTLFSQELQRRILQCISVWFSRSPVVLTNPDMRLGVSHGACIYALARQGQAQLIDAGLAQACFVGVELKDKSQSLLCVAQASQQEAVRQSPDLVLQLRSQKKVQFPLYRLDIADAKVGMIVPHQGELPVSIVETKIPNQDGVVPVRLQSELMPTGELRLILKNQRHSEEYCLDFAVLQDMQKIRQSQFPYFNQMLQTLIPVYGKGGESVSLRQIRGLSTELEALASLSKAKWPVALCRKLAGWLIEEQRARRRSEAHEQMYYSLLGYCLRPGFGSPQDQELVSRVELGFTSFVKSVQNRIEYWILMRRIAGGLGANFQKSLFESYGWYVTGAKQGLKLPGPSPSTQEQKEMLRAFMSMEFLEVQDKIVLFEPLFRRLKSGSLPSADYWMLQRLSTRRPYYAEPNRVLPVSMALGLLEFLAGLEKPTLHHSRLALKLLSRRGHRDFAIEDQKIKKFSQVFGLLELEEDEDNVEEGYGFGEGLPLGLRLPAHAG